MLTKFGLPPESLPRSHPAPDLLRKHQRTTPCHDTQTRPDPNAYDVWVPATCTRLPSARSGHRWRVARPLATRWPDTAATPQRCAKRGTSTEHALQPVLCATALTANLSLRGSVSKAFLSTRTSAPQALLCGELPSYSAYEGPSSSRAPTRPKAMSGTSQCWNGCQMVRRVLA